ALKYPETFVGINAVPLLWFSTLVAPVRDLLAWIPNRVLKLTGQPPVRKGSVSEAVFRTMVDAGKEEGVLDAQEQRLIHNVFNLDDIQVVQIMTSAADVCSLRINMTVEEAMESMKSERY